DIALGIEQEDVAGGKALQKQAAALLQGIEQSRIVALRTWSHSLRRRLVAQLNLLGEDREHVLHALHLAEDMRFIDLLEIAYLAIGLLLEVAVAAPQIEAEQTDEEQSRDQAQKPDRADAGLGAAEIGAGRLRFAFARNGHRKILEGGCPAIDGTIACGTDPRAFAPRNLDGRGSLKCIR